MSCKKEVRSIHVGGPEAFSRDILFFTFLVHCVLVTQADDKSFLEEERKRLEPCSGVHDLNGAVQLRRIGKVSQSLYCTIVFLIF